MTGSERVDELLGGVVLLLLLLAARVVVVVVGVGTGVFMGLVHDLGGESATPLAVAFMKQPGASGDMTPVDEQVDEAEEVGVRVALVLS